MRPIHLLLLAGGAASPLAAQASPYVPLDDARLPAFEYLVARGTVVDPSPQVRPFRRADALRALATADTLGAPDRRLLQELRAAWVQDTAEAAWTLEGRLGGDGYTASRRNPLDPVGPGGARPYGELAGTMRAGPFVAVSRSAVEPRLEKDPDWPGRKNLVVVGRMADAYISGQWHYASFTFGAMDQQWGPAGVPGIPLSADGYPRTGSSFEIGTPRLHIAGTAAQLTDDRDTLGARIHRFWFAHRLTIAPSRRFALAFWETTVIAGLDREFDPRWRNPAAILLLSDQYGLGSDGNIMVGSDVTWWPRRRLRFEAQLAIDDINYPDLKTSDHTPSRYAFTLALTRPVGASATAKLLYTQVSSLALRTRLPEERYADVATGLGRTIVDADQLSLFLAHPLSPSWMVTPEFTLLRRGEGRIETPFPKADASAGLIPTLFIGTQERTWRLALGVAGAQGPLHASGSLGFHYVQDRHHVAGDDRRELQAQLRLTYGFATGGRLQ